MVQGSGFVSPFYSSSNSTVLLRQEQRPTLQDKTSKFSYLKNSETYALNSANPGGRGNPLPPLADSSTMTPR